MKLHHFSPAVLAVALFCAAGIGGVEVLTSPAHAAQPLYTCGMHPQVIKTQPGNCPICGMKLTPVRAGATGAVPAPGERKIRFYQSATIPGEVSDRPGNDSQGRERVPVYEDEIDAAGAITIDPITIQKMNLKTEVVGTGPVRRTIRAVGTVDFNEEGLIDITTKYEGWIEKLHVNATWTAVKAGMPLFEMYSPDLYNAQLNYLVALRTEGERAGPLTRAARARLALFDVPEDLVAEIARAGEARRTVMYPAPSDGIVIDKPAVQGMMVRPGEKIMRIADLSSVWVTAQIYEKDLAFVKAGQDAVVRTTYGGGREFPGVVDMILPEIAAATRTAQARLTISNPGRALKPGMFVEVRLEAELAPSAVLVPDVAVLRSGERNTVFVARDSGTFEPREVRLGGRTRDGFYAVESGLAAGERVVTSGQFMLDSESQLRDAIQKMIRAAGPAAPTDSVSPSTTAADPVANLSPAARTALTALAFAAADAAVPLAADNVEGYREQVPALRAALKSYFSADEHAAHGPLGRFKDAPLAPADLKAARREFEVLSTAIADLARAHQLHRTENLRVFECPMAPELGKGRWLQRDAGTKNPFFGSKMLRCGAELDPRPEARAGQEPTLN